MPEYIRQNSSNKFYNYKPKEYNIKKIILRHLQKFISICFHEHWLFYVPKIRGNISINILQFISFIYIFFILINKLLVIILAMQYNS
jgi:hypothetical protein